MATNDPTGEATDYLTIKRRVAEFNLGPGVVYRADDGRILTFEEVFDELTPELAEGLEGLPPEEQVLDGGDVQEFINESGRYGSIEVDGRIVTNYSDGRTRWTGDQLRETFLATTSHSKLTFDDWKTSQLLSGKLKPVEVLQFIGYEEEDSDDETVLTERVIID